MKRLVLVEELARVEGHGGITVELDGERVERVTFDLFEGPRAIESLIKGRSPYEVAPIVSRICAICSAVHFITSLKATEAAFGVQPSTQTVRLRDLLLRGGNIESHALHVFLLAAPDYLGYPAATAMAADHPDVVKLGLRLKKLGNTIQEAVGGRAVHPVAPVLGGFSSVPTIDALKAIRDELLWALDVLPAAASFLASLPPTRSCDVTSTYAAVIMPDRYGYYAGDKIAVHRNGERFVLSADDYRSLTREQVVEHSFAKHSAFQGQPFMVGALARLAVNGGRLLSSMDDLAKRFGLRGEFSRDPLDNNFAQAVELAYDLSAARDDVEALLASGVIAQKPARVTPRAGTGTGVTEAPRGILVHSYTYDESGRVAAADIITPTAMNAANVERHFQVAVEQHPGEADLERARRLEMIARAYDPCISCSVHLIRKR